MSLSFKEVRKSIVQLFINLLLFIIAVLLFCLLTPINAALVLLKNSTLSSYFLSTATTIDKVAGWEFRTLWKKVLITENGIGFNDIRFTMSYHLGINKERQTLTKVGIWICDVLHFLDKDHVEKAVAQVREAYKL